MIFTVAFTAPSFAEGMAMLLRGAPAGVLKVHHYPKVVHHHYSISFNDSPSPTSLNLLAAEQQLHFNIYWPQYMPKNYSLAAINLYNDPTNGWADGPVIELVYNLDPGSGAIKGTGEIVIREFKPLVQTLQVVKDDAVNAIEPDTNGNPTAIYVNGQWQAPNKFIHTWVYGTRSEVIFQQDGVVFWIAGDQRDGIGEKDLWKLTQSLETMSFIRPGLLQDVMVTLLQASDTVNGPFSTDVLAIDNGSDNPYYLSLSSYVSGKTTTPKNPTHVH